MKTIDVIRPGSLSSIIGPSGTLKRIIKNKDYFQGRGYDINIFTHDSIGTGKANVVQVLTKDVDKRPFYRKLLTKISQECRLKAKNIVPLANYYLKLCDRRVEALVKYYISLNRRPDIVVCHSDTEAVQFMKLSPYKPKVVTFFHSDGTHTMSLSYFPCVKGKWGEQHMLNTINEAIKKSDRLVFISKIAYDSFISRHPEISIDKIKLAVNGIKYFTEDEKAEMSGITSRYKDFKYRLCCTGTINRRKGQWIVINALAKMDTDKRKNIHVSFIGDGPQRESLEQDVRDKGLEKNITFEGSVDNSHIYKYLAEHNIYILMSDNEGLPISIIEAMRAGLPVISTRVGGIPETVDKNGLLLDVSQEQLLDVLNNMDKYDWTEMGKLSYHKFEKEFTFKRMAKEYCDVMDSLFEDNGK